MLSAVKHAQCKHLQRISFRLIFKTNSSNMPQDSLKTFITMASQLTSSKILTARQKKKVLKALAKILHMDEVSQILQNLEL